MTKCNTIKINVQSYNNYFVTCTTYMNSMIQYTKNKRNIRFSRSGTKLIRELPFSDIYIYGLKNVSENSPRVSGNLLT